VANFNSIPSKAILRFWDKYINTLYKHGVKPNADRWYVIRAEEYIRSLSHKRLSDQNPEDLAIYLKEKLQSTALQMWQRQQMVDAIRYLFVIAKVPWVEQFNWDASKYSNSTSPAQLPSPKQRGAKYSQQQYKGSCGPSEIKLVRERHSESLSKLSDEIQRRNYSVRTYEAYEQWVCRFIAFHDHCNPSALSIGDVCAFLEELAIRGKVAASTQNQARHALIFYYKNILKQPLGDISAFQRAKKSRKRPTVLSQAEVNRLLGGMSGVNGLMTSLLYGTGMWLMECLQLCVMQIDFECGHIRILDGKGRKDRDVQLPELLLDPLRSHLEVLEMTHKDDLLKGLEIKQSMLTKCGNGAGNTICLP